MITLMPAPWQVAMALSTPSRGGSTMPTRPQKPSACSWASRGRRGQRTGRQGDDAQALRRHLILGLQDAVAGGGIQFADSAREMDRSAQRQHALKRPLQ
jgi:hypothetical protein